MASLRRRLGTKHWFACFTDAAGRRVQRSTATTDRKLALKIANDWESVARRRATEAQCRRVLADLHEQIHGAPLAFFTLRAYAKQWLDRKKLETREVSYLAYRYSIDHFVEFVGPKADLPIGYITPAMVASWRDDAAAKSSPRTANNKLKIARTFLQSAWRDGLLPDGNPAAKVQGLASGEAVRRPFTMEEIRAVLDAATADWRGMVLLGLYTGQRLKDLAGLTWANVDLLGKEIALTTSKTGRRQIIPIAPPLLRYLETLPAGDDPKAPLFPELHKHAINPRGSSRLSAAFQELLVAAELAAERGPKHVATGKGRAGARERSELSFHSLRHTATSMLKMAGVSEAVARDLIGHDSKDVSAHYTHTDEASKRAAIARLPDVTEAKK